MNRLPLIRKSLNTRKILFVPINKSEIHSVKTFETSSQHIKQSFNQKYDSSAFGASVVLASTKDLLKYDKSNINEGMEHFFKKTSEGVEEMTLDFSEEVIAAMKKTMHENGECPGLFGQRHNNAFESSIASVFATFGDTYLIPTVEQMAANLMYNIVKNHGFVDGNKRIALNVFDAFLGINGYKGDLHRSTLTFLVLLVAESSMNDREKILSQISQLLVREHIK
jgi:death-on-curing family protein